MPTFPTGWKQNQNQQQGVDFVSVVSAFPWLNRTAIARTAGAAAAAVYAFGFTPAVGSLLVVIGMGPVTWTTPTGWTLAQVQLNTGGLYVFTKIAVAGDVSFTTDHNGTGGADFPTSFQVYEFKATSTFQTGSSAHLTTASAVTLPGYASGLIGTNNLAFWNVLYSIGNNKPASTIAITAAGSTSILNSTQLNATSGAGDGTDTATNYIAGQSASIPAATVTETGSPSQAGETITFVISVAP